MTKNNEVQSEFLGFYKPEWSSEPDYIRHGIIRLRYRGGFHYSEFYMDDLLLESASYPAIDMALRRAERALYHSFARLA